MTCRKCGSTSRRSFKSELTIAFREPASVNLSPVYVSQDLSICLDCGHVELTIPQASLDQLKQVALETDSRR